MTLTLFKKVVRPSAYSAVNFYVHFLRNINLNISRKMHYSGSPKVFNHLKNHRPSLHTPIQMDPKWAENEIYGLLYHENESLK